MHDTDCSEIHINLSKQAATKTNEERMILLTKIIK